MCQREDKYVYLVNERYWRGYIYIEETGLVFELGLYFLCKYLKQRNVIIREHNNGCYEIIRGGSNTMIKIIDAAINLIGALGLFTEVFILGLLLFVDLDKWTVIVPMCPIFVCVIYNEIRTKLIKERRERLRITKMMRGSI